MALQQAKVICTCTHCGQFTVIPRTREDYLADRNTNSKMTTESDTGVAICCQHARL